MSKIVGKRIDEVCTGAQRNGTLTLEQINLNPGPYPVYAASVGVSIGSISTYLNKAPAIIIPTAGNGCAGKPYIVEDEAYTIGANAVGYFPNANIDLYYLFLQLKERLLRLVKGESFKSIGKGLIDSIVVPIPVRSDGTYDLEEQQRLAGIYSEIEDQKQKLLRRAYDIRELLIHIDKEEGIEYKDIELNKMITHHNGDASYTKTWCQGHKGIYPVYSANNFEPIDYVDTFDYDGEYITYSKNGCAGYITIIKGRFSVNGDRCVITISDEFKDRIDLLYFKYYLEPIFRKNKKGRLGTFGKNEFTKLNSTMIKDLHIKVPVPLAVDGSYDLEKQREIADRYRQIDEIKHGLIDKITQLTSISVIPETIEE